MVSKKSTYLFCLWFCLLGELPAGLFARWLFI